MILNELVLHNVGTFAGRHVIDLTPPSPDKPIVLVGGLNGAGKTTFLESIQLALYGSLAHGTGRRAGGYENYLRGLIHRGVPASEGAVIELTFTAHQEGAEHTYTVRRSWKNAGASIRELLLVSVNGRYDQSLTSTWNEHVETFLPRGIAGLFFFDGEQIEALADMDRSRQVLSSALAALLGLDLVERLSTDLTVLKRRHKGEKVPDGLRQIVEEKNRLLTAGRQAEETAVQAEAGRRTEMERRQKVLHEATEAYRAAGGDLLDRRESAEADAGIVRSGLAQCEDHIRHEISGVSPLLQLDGLLEQLGDQVHREADAQRNTLMLEAFEARDFAVLRELRGANMNGATVAAVEQLLRSDRDGRRVFVDAEEIIGFRDPSALEALLTTTLPEARKRLQSAVDRREELKSELDQAERVLAAIPDPEALAPLRRQREDARDELLRAEAAHTVAVELVASTRAASAKANAAYEAALDKAALVNLTADDDRRLVEHVDRVRATLEDLRIAAARRHLERISQLILEALGMLLRKENLITDVQIDPETHEVSLTGADGRPLPAKDLSAGERQLLAVALLWGLARASGQPLPVVIDTPLGRLDGSHREHLLERYFPNASHQVVLLSTDTEIDEEAFARISPSTGLTYHLEFDVNANATRVETGYFWEK
ncbi:DNA sulfur modification protein DndD [Arthrobacter sp. CAU 1506]|uniref:DNA sulfur modification protein DndD n=1 Tax=Arthrobacter sp. CAU 1506 TaxID=2560052 RepID=UPI0010ACC418|nr:DNA sulfur modification protein DndD [Arthrobacter sp. CAU 1506]TJY69475.1 DNA sulfur modification protein DndD [Arthrobacter sp. CAU 1506]